MSWIKKIIPDKSDRELENIYDELPKSAKEIENFVTANSLRVETIKPFFDFSESTVYSKNNKLPGWFIESIGMYVSYLNACEYFVEHHYRKLKELMPIKSRVEKIRSALAEDSPQDVFDVWEQAIMNYAKNLTLTPASITNETIEELRLCGLEDDEILEATQIISYFCFTNRIAQGLGITIEE